jgi:hypothetical protein
VQVSAEFVRLRQFWQGRKGPFAGEQGDELVQRGKMCQAHSSRPTDFFAGARRTNIGNHVLPLAERRLRKSLRNQMWLTAHRPAGLGSNRTTSFTLRSTAAQRHAAQPRAALTALEFARCTLAARRLQLVRPPTVREQHEGMHQ